MAKALLPRGRVARRTLILGALVVLLAAGGGLLVAWSRGAFESRLMYWHARGQDCGSVEYGPNGKLRDRSAAEQAVACFAAAHARCEAATLTRNMGGVDTAEKDMFVIEPKDTGAGCDLGMHYSFSIVGNPGTTTREVQCASVTSADGALTIGGCQGFGDFTMP